MPRVRLSGGDLDGLELHYVAEGRGPATLLIHGLGGFAASWRYTIEALAPLEYRCKICDLPLQDRKCGNPLCNWHPSERYFEWNYAIAMRSGVLEDAINRFKYDNRRGWARIFGRVLVGFLDNEKPTCRDFDLILASPTYLDPEGALPRGVAALFDNFGRAAKQVRNATPAEVFFKDSIRIVQIADDQIESREITCQFRRELRIPHEEAGERPVFD